MAQRDDAVDVGYKSAPEFWDEIVLASAGRFETQPTRAHAMAVAIYVSHFLDWVFCEKHRDERRDDAAYETFKKRHHAACPVLGWLATLADVQAQPAAFSLIQRNEAGVPALYLVLPDGTPHRFGDVVVSAIAYWQANR